MKNSTGLLVAGVAVVGLVILLRNKGGTTTPKFKVGDQITAIPVLPTNVIYQILEVNVAGAVYGVQQFFNGALVPPTQYLSIPVIDANYQLVA